MRSHQCLATIWLSLLFPAPAVTQTQTVFMDSAARVYLRGALDTMQVVTMEREKIPWQRIRDSAFVLAEGARKPADTYGAIAWALHRVNRHSFLQANPPGAVSEVVDRRYGYIHVPQRGGAAVDLADSLHGAVARLDSAHVCGWIVDLRGNGGGNMWPMLAGIGPLVGDSIVGSFGIGPNAARWYYKDGASGILTVGGKVDTASRITRPSYTLRNPNAPVAILADEGTGSSGEAIVVAFRGRPNSRSFGSATAGFMTTNRGSMLPDGANMVVTTGYYADRTGFVYERPIQPDVVVRGGMVGWPFATDRVSRAAARWLGTRPECREVR
jgi:C-terminal processing protease CtpA/Prc